MHDPEPSRPETLRMVHLQLGRLLADVQGAPFALAAQAYAAAGMPVFPCLPGGKRPLTGHGHHDATTDLEQIGKWWRRWPGANIALPTGTPGGIDVMDVDVRATGSGIPALRRARMAGLVDGWTAIVGTPSAGLHLYFPADEGRPQRCWQSAATHIDFRGVGGYVIIPPSVTAAGRYTLIRAAERGTPCDAPGLRALLEPDRPRRTQAPTDLNRRTDVARVVAWLSGRAEGERNRSLFWAACRLAETGLRQDDIIDALTAPSTRIGLPEDEIATTIRSAIRTTQHTDRLTAPHGTPVRPLQEGPVLR